jgi:hypothetical protein
MRLKFAFSIMAVAIVSVLVVAAWIAVSPGDNSVNRAVVLLVGIVALCSVGVSVLVSILGGERFFGLFGRSGKRGLNGDR